MIEPEQLNESFVPKARTDVAAAEVDGDVVLYDERSSQLHILNPTAGVVWAHCDGSASLAQIIDELSRIFGVEGSQLADDVTTMVRDLGDLGVLEGLATTPPAPLGGSSPPATGHDGGGGGSPFSIVPPSP